MAVNAKEVQELRKISGAGMMECKSALSESKGNINEAFKILREKGIAKAEKKSSRDAKEGIIGLKVDQNKATIVEVNSETDFVSRNSEFHKLVRSILNISINNSAEIDKTKIESKELINDAVGKIGENIVLKRISYIEGNIYSYVHNSVSDGLGKIGVLLNIDTDSNDIAEIGKNICMHIAALNPKSISQNDLDVDLINSEKQIIMQQLKDSGKPENIIEKMLEGKMNKFYEESTLLGQKFVIDNSMSISEYLEQSSENLKKNISIKEFIRFEIGS
tara:strand:+ start:2242 stop:3069 length:828 start_codon:yes stop_codon:yes gene_type:complete